MAEAFQEPSKEYYKQTNYQDYSDRFSLERKMEDLVRWEKAFWRRLNLHMRLSTPCWFFQALSHLTELKSKCGEALVELVLFDYELVTSNVAPHLLGMTCFVCGIVLTQQAEECEAHPVWKTLRRKSPDFFWPRTKRCTQEMFLQLITKAADPKVLRDLKRPSNAQWRHHGRKSIEGHFPPSPWPMDVILRLSAQSERNDAF